MSAIKYEREAPGCCRNADNCAIAFSWGIRKRVRIKGGKLREKTNTKEKRKSLLQIKKKKDILKNIEGGIDFVHFH